MGVSKNSGTPKSSILIGFSIINHPFWGTTILGNTHIYLTQPIGTMKYSRFNFIIYFHFPTNYVIEKIVHVSHWLNEKTLFVVTCPTCRVWDIYLQGLNLW